MQDGKDCVKKVLPSLIILVATQLDLLMGLDYIRYSDNSLHYNRSNKVLVENSGVMGVPIPRIVINAIDILKKKDEDFKDEGMKTLINDGDMGELTPEHLYNGIIEKWDTLRSIFVCPT